VFIEAVREILPARRCGSRLVDHDNIQSCQQCLLLAKRLSNNSFNTVSFCRSAAVLLGDCQTQPCDACLIAPAEHGKKLIAATGGLVEHAAESRRIKKPVVYGEPVT